MGSACAGSVQLGVAARCAGLTEGGRSEKLPEYGLCYDDDQMNYKSLRIAYRHQQGNGIGWQKVHKSYWYALANPASLRGRVETLLLGLSQTNSPCGY